MINICRATGNWRQHSNVFLNCSTSEELYCRGQHREMGRTGSSQLTPILTPMCPHPHEGDNMPVRGLGLAWHPGGPQPLPVTKLHDPFIRTLFEVSKQLITNFLDARL